MNFENLTLKNLKKTLNVTIRVIKKKNYFTIWKINILQFEKLLNCGNNL